MDRLDFLEDEELLLFFQRHKTDMACMDNPRIFVTKLRDYNLVPEDKFQKMMRTKSTAVLQKTLYEVLDWLETKRSLHIRLFWSCVFKDPIMNQYRTLRQLHNSIIDGSYCDDMRLPERVEMKERDREKNKELSGDEEEDRSKKGRNGVEMKRKGKVCGEKEQAGPSCTPSPSPSKRKKQIFSSPLMKGEKAHIWNWPIYKRQVPVTCGELDGILDRERLTNGEKCIVVDKKWFTPPEFERAGGKEQFRNWKLSIQCANTPLKRLLEKGHLKSGGYRGKGKKAKKSLMPSALMSETDEGDDEDTSEESDLDDQASTRTNETCSDFADEEEEMAEQGEQQFADSHDSERKVFKVTCNTLAGTLYKERFVSGTCGKSIRTQTSWMTPMDFVNQALCQTDASWKKDIKWKGKPIGVLIEDEILRIHSLLCVCSLCKPTPKDLEKQKNDDECCICKSAEEELVLCDCCPRSFHQKCHLPHVEDESIGDDSLWMCTFCVFESNRDLYIQDRQKMEAVLSRQISQHMLKCHYLLLHLREQQTFAPDPRHSRMCLGSIADKLEQRLYHTVGEFESDVQLVFTQSAASNQENAEFLAVGKRLKDFFVKDFKKIFDICQ